MIRNRILQFLVFMIPLFLIGMLSYVQYAEMDQEQVVTESIVISEVMAKNLSGIQDAEGDYSDWIEIYNATENPINLKGYGLSDSLSEPYKWRFPEIELESDSYLIVWASGKDAVIGENEIHTNFGLDSSEEILVLSSAEGEMLDEFQFQDMEWDISYGRSGWNMEAAGYFNYATPGAANPTDFLTKQEMKVADIGEVKFSVQGGFFSDSFELELSCEDENAIILYTTDGSEPGGRIVIYIQDQF